MKMSIEWHKKCLLNRERHLQGLINQLVDMQEKVTSTVLDNQVYFEQIEAAEKAGKDGFDSDRYRLDLKKDVEQK